MKARTKHQKKVVELNKRFPKIDKVKVKKWAFKVYLFHKGIRTKTGKIHCLDCGHTWQTGSSQAWHDHLTENTCPNCKTKLKIEETSHRVFSDMAYFNKVDTFEGYQVITLFMVRAHYKAGEKPRKHMWEIGKIWFNFKDDANMTKQLEIIGQYNGWGDNWCGGLELRSNKGNQPLNINCMFTYPERSVLPIFKRNGFKHSFYKCSPYDLLTSIAYDSKSETLLKAKQISLLNNHINSYYGLPSRNWRSIKIAMRNKYIVKDASMWFDYIEMLEYFKIDYNKAEWLCPPDLKAAHDKWMRKKAIIEEAEQRRRELEDHKRELRLKRKQRAHFNMNKKRFKDLNIVGGDYSVEMFNTMAQVKRESNMLKHCAYSSKYHLKLNSFIMSARWKGDVVATVEISLKKFTVLQCRGYSNKTSKHNREIIALMQKHLHKIRDIVEPKKKKKSKQLIAA